MKKDEFIEELVDILELEEDVVDFNTEIDLTSLDVLSMIAFIDENFDKQVNIDQLKEVGKISDLMLLIGSENIEN